jgi:hypothetical protein
MVLAFLAWMITIGLLVIPSGLLASKLDYYSLYADSLVAGRLWVAEGATPASCVMDGSWYEGRCYLYWGIVPAFFHLLLPFLGDRLASIAAAAVATFFLLRIVLELGRRLAPGEEPDPLIAAPLSLFVTFGTGLATTALCGWVYGEAICFALAFAMSGLWLLLPLLLGDTTDDAAAPWLALGASLLGLAALTRASFFLVLLGVAALVAIRTWPRLVSRQVVMVALPIALAFALQAWLNHARFGSPFDFGTAYVYPNPSLPNAQPDQAHYGLEPVPYNLLSYFFTGLPPRLTMTPGGQLGFAFPALTRFAHADYHVEFPSGLFLVMPSLLLGLRRLPGLARSSAGRGVLGLAAVFAPVSVLIIAKEHQIWRYQLELWLPVLLCVVPLLLASSRRVPGWEVMVHWTSLLLCCALTVVNTYMVLQYRSGWL